MTKSEQAEDALAHLNETRERLLVEIRKGIIGQDEVIEQLLVTLLARGHCLLTGIPGLGKTLLVKTLAKCLSLSGSRGPASGIGLSVAGLHLAGAAAGRQVAAGGTSGSVMPSRLCRKSATWSVIARGCSSRPKWVASGTSASSASGRIS